MDSNLMSTVVTDLMKRFQAFEERSQKNIDLIMALQKENVDLTRKIQSIEERESKHLATIESLKANSDVLSKQMQKETSEIIGCLRNESHNLSNRVQILEERLESKYLASMECFKATNDSLSKKMQAINDVKRETLGVIGGLKNESHNLSNRIHILEKSVESLDTLKGVKEDMLSNGMQTIDNVKKETEKLIGILKDDVSTKVQTLELQVKTNADMVTSLSSINKNSDATNLSLEKEASKSMESISRKMQSLESKNDNLSQKLQDSCKSNSDLIKSMKEEMKALELKIAKRHVEDPSLFLAKMDTEYALDTRWLDLTTVSFHGCYGDCISFDSSNGVLSIKETGIYLFGWRGRQFKDGKIRWAMKLDALGPPWLLGETRESNYVISGTLMVYLKKDIQVWVKARQMEGDAEISSFVWYGKCLKKIDCTSSMETFKDGLKVYLNW